MTHAPYKSIKAIEFFSGVGAFSQALATMRHCPIEVVAAFDQNHEANRVYLQNYGHGPITRNLASVKSDDICSSDFWWLSPPCTPFSVRGKRRDDEDPRSQAFLNLLSLLPEALPRYLIVENVVGFESSRTFKKLKSRLDENGYRHRLVKLCTTDFNVPMRRPRVFVVASRQTRDRCDPEEMACSEGTMPSFSEYRDERTLVDYLGDLDNPAYNVNPSIIERYRQVMNIVDPFDPETVLICFTRGYFRCKQAGGSLLRFGDAETLLPVRYVSPADIANLLGFSEQFSFPEDMTDTTRWRLIGNSVDVRAIRYLLGLLGFKNQIRSVELHTDPI